MKQLGMFAVGCFTVFLFTLVCWDTAGASEISPADLSPLEASLVDHQATVYFIQGSAQVLKKNAPAWEGLTVGSAIQEGDQIRTAEGCAVEVEFDQFLQNRSRIESQTLAEFKSIEPTQIYLSDGTLLNMLEGLPSASGFEVISPTAVASVRGTIFVTTYQASAQIQKASVIQGQIQIYAPKEPGSTETSLPGWLVKRYESLDLDFRPEALPHLAKSQTRLVNAEDLLALKTRVEESQSRQNDFHQGAPSIEQAKAAWIQLRSDLHRMEAIEAVLHKEESKLLAPRLEKSAALAGSNGPAADSDEVLIDSSIVETPEEYKTQDQLLGAKKAHLGTPDDE